MLMTEWSLGDLVQLRKTHPCGGDTWVVVRLGADIGLQCQICQHRVLLTRRELAKSTKKILRKMGDEPVTT